MRVPTASTRSGAFGMSLARSRRDTITAVAPTAGHHRRPALVAWGGAFVNRAEPQHVVREPGRDRQARVDHRAELARGLEAAVVPAALQAQRVHHLVCARAAEAGWRPHG